MLPDHGPRVPERLPQEAQEILDQEPPMRVPASIVVRMNSASNMIAKWYQTARAVRLWNTPESIWAMPSAKVGAPPARPTIVRSPTLEARAAMSAGVTAKPRALMCCVTVATSPFTLIAKYSPGAIEQAAMTAMTPTHISVIMAP
jgi:hypothetical protein